MSKKQRIFSIRLSEEMHFELERLAEDLNSTKSHVFVRAWDFFMWGEKLKYELADMEKRLDSKFANLEKKLDSLEAKIQTQN